MPYGSSYSNPYKGSRYDYVRRTAVARLSARSARANHLARLKDTKINTAEERRMVEIADDQTTTWLLSRIDHFKAGEEYGGSHKSPDISKMIKLSNNTLYWQDITQLPAGDPSDEDPEMSLGLYQIKTIQSRLRFFADGLMPIHVRVLLIRINNSGRYAVAGQNLDIVPNSKMVPDTSLRYAGIHKIEGKYTTAPGSKGAQIIAQKSFKIIPSNPTSIINTVPAVPLILTRQVYKEKQVFLTKKYKKYLKLYQVMQQTALDTNLSANESKNKLIGDRIFLCIYANYQQGYNPDLVTNTTSTSNLYFYGTSGCIYNFDKKPMQVSIPLADQFKIDNTAYQT